MYSIASLLTLAMAKLRADDELCTDHLNLFTLLFLNYASSVVKINDALSR